jgi:hypothetical protein
MKENARSDTSASLEYIIIARLCRMWSCSLDMQKPVGKESYVKKTVGVRVGGDVLRRIRDEHVGTGGRVGRTGGAVVAMYIATTLNLANLTPGTAFGNYCSPFLATTMDTFERHIILLIPVPAGRTIDSGWWSDCSATGSCLP